LGRLVRVDLAPTDFGQAWLAGVSAAVPCGPSAAAPHKQHGAAGPVTFDDDVLVALELVRLHRLSGAPFTPVPGAPAFPQQGGREAPSELDWAGSVIAHHRAWAARLGCGWRAEDRRLSLLARVFSLVRVPQKVPCATLARRGHSAAHSLDAARPDPSLFSSCAPPRHRRTAGR